MLIGLSFDFDYKEDYDFMPRIFETLEGTPATLFLAGSRHPEKKLEYPPTCEIGNHSYQHEEWYGAALNYRVDDLMMNHEFLKNRYGVDCKVYRSPHLRNFPDTAKEMVLRGYKPEIECAECSVCQPMQHAHLKQYFSSHHHFISHCNLTILQNFEAICKKGKDFTFFLDPHHFPEERLPILKNLIGIGKKYGDFKLLGDQD